MSMAIASAAPQAAVAPGPRLRSVLGLTRVEGRRLITHPVILVGPGLVLLIGARSPEAFQFLFLSGLGYFAIGIGTFVAANLCASRSRRDRTEELLSSLPLRAADRTAAQLLSVAFPVAAAAFCVAVRLSVLTTSTCSCSTRRASSSWS